MGSCRFPQSALGASFALLLGLAAQGQASSPAPAVAELMARSQQSFARARYDEAEKTLREAARLEPSQVAIWVALGQACYAQKRWDPALEAFEKARMLAPGDARIDSNIGVCAHERGDLDRARDALERVVASNPSDSRANLFLARIAWSKGETERAEQLFGKALASERLEPIAPYYQGLFLYQERRLGEARVAFERALQSMPDHVASHMNLGLVLDRLGETEGSERHLARFRELNDLRVADHKRKLEVADRIASAQRDVDAGHYEAALANALAAQRLADEVPAVHSLLGSVYHLLGRADDSARETARARELAERERRR
jgi:Flp pilus assembly protein TadD